MKTFTLCTLTSLAICLPLGALGASGDLEREFAIGPGGSLVLEADAGYVEVTTWNEPRVRVVVQNPDNMELEFEESGNRLLVTAEIEGRWSGRRAGFRFQVPAQFNLDLETSGGSIEISDLEGDIDAETSGGSITIGNISNGSVNADTAGGSITIGDVSGDVNADTAGGSITVGQVGGDAELDTAGGSIRAGYVNGTLEADTAGGSIRVEGGQLGVIASTAGGSITVQRSGGPVQAETAGGSISLGKVSGAIRASTSGGSISAELTSLDAGVSGQVDLETAGGDLELTLPATHQASIDASIEVSRRARGDYRIYTDFPLTIQGEDDREVTAEGDINGGGDRIRLRTVNGDIRITRGNPNL
ncbi:MAG: hypothetical protein RLZZ385_2065 [Pseudomonadota bacterium]|jgi:DUF4097 and DUF4098 domain-containing protein YvlB